MQLGDIAQRLGGELIGDASLDIRGVSSLDEAVEGYISLVAEKRFLDEAKQSKASAFLSYEALPFCDHVIVVERPRTKLSDLIACFHDITPAPVEGQQHVTAQIHETATLGRPVEVGPYAVIGADTHVEDGTSVGAHAVIGKGCRIGKGCVIYPNATLYDGVVLGDHVIVHAGVVLGADGFGYQQVAGEWIKVPHVGRVVIGDHVELMPNTCVAKGCLGDTRIGTGTKLDTMVHIAHNVTVGDHSAIAGQVGTLGRAKIGHHVQIGGQTGVSDVSVGDYAVVVARSGVTKDVPAKTLVSGFPAWPHANELKKEATIRKMIR